MLRLRAKSVFLSPYAFVHRFLSKGGIEEDAADWVHNETDVFQIKCDLADDILARLVQEVR